MVLLFCCWQLYPQWNTQTARTVSPHQPCYGVPSVFQHLSCLEKFREMCLFWGEGTLFFFFSLPAVLGRDTCWFGLLLTENQYFPFLRMQNELLLRWALWRDWRLSLSHNSSEDFHKDIYFFSPGVNAENMDLLLFPLLSGHISPAVLKTMGQSGHQERCTYLNKQSLRVGVFWFPKALLGNTSILN